MHGHPVWSPLQGMTGGPRGTRDSVNPEEPPHSQLLPLHGARGNLRQITERLRDSHSQNNRAGIDHLLVFKGLSSNRWQGSRQLCLLTDVSLSTVFLQVSDPGLRFKPSRRQTAQQSPGFFGGISHPCRKADLEQGEGKSTLDPSPQSLPSVSRPQPCTPERPSVIIHQQLLLNHKLPAARPRRLSLQNFLHQ